MFETPRRGRQARNFKTNVPKILVLKSSSEQIFSRKLPLGAPEYSRIFPGRIYMKMEFSSQRREMLLFLTTSMAAVTSRANQEFAIF